MPLVTVTLGATGGQSQQQLQVPVFSLLLTVVLSRVKEPAPGNTWSQCAKLDL